MKAIPDHGYDFIEWSDGYSEEKRRDLAVTGDISLTAKFALMTRTYRLNYMFNKIDKPQSEVTLTYSELENTAMPIPATDDCAFGGWYSGEVQITDAQGRFLSEEDVFTLEDRELYAKWTPYDPYTYKILLVYVTEIHATLEHKNVPDTVTVDHVMSDLERQACAAVTVQTKRYLDDMMDGFVTFEIDEYYTTVPVLTENFQTSPGDNTLLPNRIPEVSELLDEYDSVVSLINLEDPRSTVRMCAGMANPKYAQVYLDSFFYWFNNDTYTDDLDFDYIAWEKGSDTIIHELAHTIELRVGLYKDANDGMWFHDVCFALKDKYNIDAYSIPNYRYYYTNQAVIDGKRVGIPHDFWAGNIITVHYRATEGGSVGVQDREVVYGQNLSPAYAETEWKGHHFESEFLGWSDGVTTRKRQDLNITESFTVTAIFQPRTWEIRYEATEGGRIIGETVQTRKFQEDFSQVEAVADEGYVFVRWSDRVLAYRRIDGTLKAYYPEKDTLFKGGFTATVTAIFEKIE
ncbi:MAG: hypothetical protein HFE27_02845 [Clostridia bacterium]|nr:hypothetical protein [Clostridia bacterium]